MTFEEIKVRVRRNLNDLGVTFYSIVDLADSAQDAYDDIAIRSRCIRKVVEIDFDDDINYYSPLAEGVSDYLGTIGIYNNNTELWLEDNISRVQLDKLGTNWELTHGQPSHWCPSDPTYIIIYPKQLVGEGNFDLHYWATAPTVADEDTPLIATDMQKLLEFYMTADLLEQQEEFTKAQTWWKKYEENLELYTERNSKIAKADLLMRM